MLQGSISAKVNPSDQKVCHRQSLAAAFAQVWSLSAQYQGVFYMRLRYLIAIPFILLLVLAGCASPSEPAAAPSDADAMMGDAPAGMGGELIIAFPASSEPASLDGHIDPYQPAWLFDSFVADPLVILAPDATYQPALAESWSSVDAGYAWTFNLRSGVVFQDGTPFNAEAVKYNIERILAPETASAQMAADLGDVSGIEVIDDLTVTIHFGSPSVNLLDALRRVPIWSPTAAEEHGLEQFDRVLTGTGPFVLEEWVPNDRIEFVKWEDYGGWNSIMDHEGTAHLDRVTVLFIGEDAVRAAMLETGDAHIVRELPAANVEDYEDREGFELITGYQAGTGLQMVINIREAPLNILELRQALQWATDQAAVNDLAYNGRYLISDGPLNVVHPCYWPGAADMYGHDPAKAIELLEEVGYTDADGDGIREAYGVPGVEDGTPLRLRWTVLHHTEIGEVVQGQWRELGIDLVLEQVAGPIQLERRNARDFDLMYERQRTPDPAILELVWHSANDVEGGWAWTGFVDEELDEAVVQILQVANPEERCELAYTAQRIILENAVMLPTLSQPQFYALSDSVKGFQLSSESPYFFLHNTYIEE